MKKIAIVAITEYDAVPTSNGRNHAMIGTFANSGAILVGSLIGIAAGRRVPERIKTIVMQGLGLSVMLIGRRKENRCIHFIAGAFHEGAAN